MKKMTLKTSGMLALSILFLFGTTGKITGDAMLELLPANGEIDRWKRSGDPEVYAGEDLYVYINGGAEIYQEYGFDKVVLQDYTGPEERTVSLEIYRMSDPGAAFGMYSFKSGSSGQALDMGSGGRLEGYYLNFWKGSYLITITGFNEDSETVKGILALGRTVAEKVKVDGREPDIMGLLPPSGLKEAGRKYVRGQLGLYNLYSFSPRNIFGVREAVKGSYKEGYDLFILAYPHSDEASRYFAEAAKAMEDEARFVRIESNEKDIHALDSRGVSLTFRVYGRNIVIALSRLGFQITDKAADSAILSLKR